MNGGEMRVLDSKPMRVATSEVARDINKRVVLNLIRTKQPISRADLARVSGLQRSTVSLIVEELVEERWVLEGPTVRLPRGRRPTFLRLNEDRVIIGVDIRPTQIALALSDVNGKFASQEAMPTPDNPQAAMDELFRAFDACSARAGARRWKAWASACRAGWSLIRAGWCLRRT